MTEKDKKLIEEAEKLSYSDWFLVREDEADTEEAREILHSIASRLYHTEEYYCGCL